MSSLFFLVDTGSQFSVLPATAADRSKGPSGYNLVAANSSVIHTFGRKTLSLSLGLRRQYPWEFVIADVSRPLLGSDFLSYHGILIDIKNKKLIDSTTHLTIKGKPTKQVPMSLSISTPEVSDCYQELLNQYADIMRPKPQTNIKHQTKHRIITNGNNIFFKPRRVAPAKLQIMKAEFQRMLDTGVARPSSSTYASPVHMVPKKTSTDWRPCGDYRALNRITLPDRYPLPHLHDFTNVLARSCVFSRIDLVKAFNQIPMHPDDVEKTALTTPFGLFEMTMMPYGLRNSAQTFQRFMDEVLRGISDIFVYIDDILIASTDVNHHLSTLEKVFQRLSNYGVVINPSKSEFGKTKISFLGHQISESGIQPTDDRISAIQEYPLPADQRSLQRFLGMVNFYHRFIPHAASLLTPLHAMVQHKQTSQKHPLKWTSSQQESFEKVKTALAKSVPLGHPQSNAPLSLVCDASCSAVGAVLQQDENGEQKPLGFFSRKLTNAQAKYSTFSGELLAVYLAIRHFRPWLEGVDFTVFTDHKPLISALQSNNPNHISRDQRYMTYIAEFTNSIQHISGSDNVSADALSRVFSVTTPDALISPETI